MIKFFESILVSVVIFFFLIVTLVVSNKVFAGGGFINSEVISAFFGAFFAFLFIKFGDAMSKLYERRAKHYNALVKLEFDLNKVIFVTNINSLIFNDYKNTFKNAREINKIVYNPLQLQLFKFNDSLMMELFGANIINKVLNYNFDIESINIELETLNSYYKQLIETSMSNLSVDTYLVNISVIEKKVDILDQELKNINRQAEDLLILSRVLMNHKPFFMRFMFWTMNKCKKISKDDLKKERDFLNKQKLEFSKTSKEKRWDLIDKILNK